MSTAQAWGVGRLGMAGDYLLASFLVGGWFRDGKQKMRGGGPLLSCRAGGAHSVAVRCDMAVEFSFGLSLGVTTLAFLEYSEGHETTDHC